MKTKDVWLENLLDQRLEAVNAIFTLSQEIKLLEHRLEKAWTEYRFLIEEINMRKKK